MKIFTILYEKVKVWAMHPLAERYLGVMSFAESSFFPIPVDVMLAPMVLVKKHKAWRYAFIAMVASVLGGAFGYFIGVYAIDLVLPLLEKMHYMDAFEVGQKWLKEWGVVAIFIAGFSPIPYKIFTIAAGAFGMAFLPFVLASIVGRGARFYLVAALMYWGGEAMENKLKNYIDIIGWAIVIFITLFIVIYKL